MISKFLNFKYSNLKLSRGFTLVEMMIAITLFLVVAAISIGAVITIFNANTKSRTSKTVVDNLDLALEDMTRTVRFGTHYRCGSGVPTNPETVGDCNNGDWMAVLFNSRTVIYRLDNGVLKKSENGGATYTTITSPDTNIQQFSVYVRGSSTSDDVQPYALVLVKGYVGSRPTTQTAFSIQTMMSQRNLDHNLP